jgi:WD40 repeat protein/serine/threonine protein kinase
MSPEDGERWEDELADLLAASDDALAAGKPADFPSTEELPREREDELKKELAYLQKVREALSPPRSEKVNKPRSELPWTTLRRFEIRRELGRGGFGVVYLAYDPKLRREVALKVPRPEILITPELRERFHREARAAAGLQHPNLVPLYEVGEAGAICFLVSAYCPGPSLADWLRQQTQAVPYRDSATLVSILADAVHHAHCHGVVHRDLKPANVLLAVDSRQQTVDSSNDKANISAAEYTEDYGSPSSLLSTDYCLLSTTPMITDFGLAKHIHGAQATDDKTLTRAGAVVGTASYMAPEQAGGKVKEIGPPADIYALGAILYELLTGRPPFRGDSDVDTLLQVQADEPIAPSRIRPRLPRDLETICLKCLEKEPPRRYVTALELAEDLRRFLAGEPIRARPVGRAERLGRWARRNPHLAALQVFSATAVLALIGISLAFALHQRNAAREIQKQAHLAERRLAQLTLDRGLGLCEQGRISQGMLWLAKSLEMAAEFPAGESAELAWLARENLAHWACEVARVRTVFPHAKGITAIAFSPDSRTVLSGSEDGTAQLWDAGTGTPVGAPLRNEGAVTAVAFSATGKVFVTGSWDGNARVWEAATSRPAGPCLAHTQTVVAAAISPDGRTVFTGDASKAVHFWDTATGKRIGSSIAPGNEVVRFATFSPDGLTVATATGNDQDALLWEVATHGLRFSLRHGARVTSVAFNPDGRTIATGGGDNVAQLWVGRTGEPAGVLFKHPEDVMCVSFASDGRTLLTNCNDRRARRWDIETGSAVVWRIEHNEGANSKVVFSPDGRSFVTLPSGWVWELLNERSRIPPLKHPYGVQAVAYNPDGRTVLTGCQDGTGRFWETATGRLTGPSLRHRGRILSVAYSPDGRSVLTGSFDKTARLWQTATGKPIGRPLQHALQVNAVAFSPDGTEVLTGSSDRTARFWEAATGNPLERTLAHQNTVEAVAYSPDGLTVLTAAAFNAVHFWERATGRLLTAAVYHPKDGVFDLACSPDGRTILTGGRDMSARLWDAATREPIAPPLPHQASVSSVAFSPDGLLVLTGSLDGTARLWSARLGKPIGPPLLHDREVMAAAFSPDGRTILTGSLDRTARLWTVPSPVAGEPERIRLWTELITGKELDDADNVHFLNSDEWRKRRQRLAELGGPPVAPQ